MEENATNYSSNFTDTNTLRTRNATSVLSANAYTAEVDTDDDFPSPTNKYRVILSQSQAKTSIFSEESFTDEVEYAHPELQGAEGYGYYKNGLRQQEKQTKILWCFVLLLTVSFIAAGTYIVTNRITDSNSTTSKIESTIRTVADAASAAKTIVTQPQKTNTVYDGWCVFGTVLGVLVGVGVCVWIAFETRCHQSLGCWKTDAELEEENSKEKGEYLSDPPKLGGCGGSEFGCCENGSTIKLYEDGRNC